MQIREQLIQSNLLRTLGKIIISSNTLTEVMGQKSEIHTIRKKCSYSNKPKEGNLKRFPFFFCKMEQTEILG